MSKYYIKFEKMGGEYYYMIYIKRWIFPDIFLERWNSGVSANERIKELRGYMKWAS